METLVITSAAVAFVLAVLEQLVDIRRFKAAISLGSSVGIMVSLGPVDAKALWTAFAAAFIAPFLIALADRIVAVPLTISRAVGQTR